MLLRYYDKDISTTRAQRLLTPTCNAGNSVLLKVEILDCSTASRESQYRSTNPEQRARRVPMQNRDL